jgi:hypothetical protein
MWSDASMEKNTKRKLAAGAVAALAVAGGGAAIGATQFTSPKEQNQAVINDAASQLGVDPSKLTDALKKGLENRVDAAVAAGQMTKAQGDALKAQIESGSNVPLILPGVGGLEKALGPLGGFGGGPGLRFGFGVGPALAGDNVFATAATYLGLTEAELKTQLGSGKTLAEIATAQGKTADGLVQALYDAQKKQLDAAVTAGKLTQSQEDAILANSKDRLTDLVNGKQPTFHIGGGFGKILGPSLDAATSYLGLTEAQLRTQLESGKTLAEIAKAQGKTADGLVQALYDAQKKQLDAAVTAGKLTQSQEDAILANLKTMLTSVVNGTIPSNLGPALRGFGLGLGPALRGFGSGFREFHNFRGLPGLPGPATPTSPSPSQAPSSSNAGTGTI